MAPSSIATHIKRLVFTALGIIFFLAVWHVLAKVMPRTVMASPLDTFRALVVLMGSAMFWRHLGDTFQRLAAGFGLGAATGCVLGTVAGLRKEVRYILEPFRWFLMSVPAVVVVVIAMLWFGMGSLMTVAITAVLVAPIVYVGTMRGMDTVDVSYLETAVVYRFGIPLTLRHIYVPAITSHVVSSLVVAAGMSVRIVILAEVLGASSGIGHALSLAGTNLDIPGLFAWVFVSTALVAMIEYGLLRPVERWVTRWRT